MCLHPDVIDALAAESRRYRQKHQIAAARYELLRRAREKGRHAAIEWRAMQLTFGKCVRCAAPYEALIGGVPTRDHVLPITDGGCDCIANIQPLCRECNTRKGDEAIDFRGNVWVGEFLSHQQRLLELEYQELCKLVAAHKEA